MEEDFTHFLSGTKSKVKSSKVRFHFKKLIVCFLSFFIFARKKKKSVKSLYGLNLPAVPRLQSSETNSRLHMSNLEVQ